jgi:hypothetical protein
MALRSRNCEPRDGQCTTSQLFVCRKHRGEISIPGGAIYEDDLVYADHAQVREAEGAAYLGYLMVERKHHAPGLADLSDAEGQALGLLVARVGRALKTARGRSMSTHLCRETRCHACTFTWFRATLAHHRSTGVSTSMSDLMHSEVVHLRWQPCAGGSAPP